jgi:hypothetical protein
VALAARIGWLGVVAILVLGLAGCSSPQDEIRQYAKQAAAAEQSTVLGTRLFREGKALEPETSTLYQDAMKELTSAHDELAQLQAEGPDAKAQDRATSSVRRAIDALQRAQRELEKGAVSPQALDALKQASSDLRREATPR